MGRAGHGGYDAQRAPAARRDRRRLRPPRTPGPRGTGATGGGCRRRPRRPTPSAPAPRSSVAPDHGGGRTIRSRPRVLCRARQTVRRASIGLVRYAAAPEAVSAEIRSGTASALTTITGMAAVAASARKLRSTSSPRRSGRWRSSRTAFGRSVRASAMPSWPPDAVIEFDAGHVAEQFAYEEPAGVVVLDVEHAPAAPARCRRARRRRVPHRRAAPHVPRPTRRRAPRSTTENVLPSRASTRRRSRRPSPR